MWCLPAFSAKRPVGPRPLAALLIAAASTLSACATIPYYGENPAVAPVAASGQRPGDWWTRINNPPLDALVQAGFDHSPTLGAILDTLRENRDALRAGDGLYLPPGTEMPVPADLDATFVLFTIDGPVAPPPAMDRPDAARQVLAADIVDATIARAAYHANIQVLQDLLAIEGQQLAQGSVDPGLSARIETNRAKLVWLRVRYDQTEHLLARLTGIPFDQWGAPQFGLGEIQPPVPADNREDLGNAAKALTEAVNALDLASSNYLGGHTPYTDVLRAETRLAEARMAVIAATAAQSQTNVAFFVAAGGDTISH